MTKITRPTSALLLTAAAFACGLSLFVAPVYESWATYDLTFRVAPIMAVLALVRLAQCLYFRERVGISILGVAGLLLLLLFIAFGWDLVHRTL